MPLNEMLYAAIRVGLTTDREDFGEAAGEEVMALAEDRGLESDTHRIYDAVVSLAAVADLVTSAVRKQGDAPWGVPKPKQLGEFTWEPSCFQVGGLLRRVLLVSSWSDSRHYGEIRSWHSIGQVAMYELPMQQVVIVLGQTRDGLKRGPWTKCFQHPSNKQIRFRKKSRSTSEVFKSTWQEIYRVDHAEISNHDWLQAMYADDVLQEVCFNVDIPVPPEDHLHRIRDMAERKLERLYSLTETPEANLSSCHFPTPCGFLDCCWNLPGKPPSAKTGFVPVQELIQTLQG